jgi:hypothetical protein
MKKIFLMFVAICAFAACDPTHEKISNGGHISVDELRAQTIVTTDIAPDGKNGNVIICETSAPVTAKFNIGGKDFVGNYAKRKMKLGPADIVMTALCPDGTVLTTSYSVTCEEVTDPLQKIYIYGGDPVAEPPFTPGAWDAAAMRFSSTEGAHLPTIPDDVYAGLKTLIFDVSDVTADFDLKVMNGWWSATYYDHVKWTDGLNELQLTEDINKDCAKGNDGRDLDLMLYSGSMLLKAVYYEE